MLRIFRRTSPMSIGTYILSSFSLFSIMTAAADLLGWRKVARVAQIPAAIAGAGMTTYTAALLAATSTPIWAAAPRALAIQFAASSIGAGAAALQLACRVDGDEKAAPALHALSAAAAATELVGALAAERTYRNIGIADSTTSRRPWGRVASIRGHWARCGTAARRLRRKAHRRAPAAALDARSGHCSAGRQFCFAVISDWRRQRLSAPPATKPALCPPRECPMTDDVLGHCHEAVAKLDYLLRNHPAETAEELTDAVRCTVTLRDKMIERRHSGEHDAALDRRLRQVNSIISAIVAGEFPLDGDPLAPHQRRSRFATAGARRRRK